MGKPTKFVSLQDNERTAFTTTCVSQLLESTANLLSRPSLARFVEDIVRDKTISHGKAAKEPGLP